MDNSVGRCCADSVHERLKILYVYCDDCNIKIPADSRNIDKHFNNSHASTLRCLYCRAKVFTYKSYSINDEGIEVVKEEHVFHRCTKHEK